MTKYIVGMIVGGIVITIGIGFWIWYAVKNHNFKKSIQRIGQSAEEQINADIKVWAKKTKNKFLPASLYAYDENKVFEVDSILLTDKALIIVEIKSIKGEIIGNSIDQYWIKKLGEEKYKITNPITQNDKHIEHIVRMTDIKIPTISLIIFSDRAKSLKITGTPTYAAVIRHSELFETLDEINIELPKKLSDDDMNQVISSIKKYRANDKKNIALHKRITRGGA